MSNYSIIAAVDQSWGIGRNGEIPWRFSEDFKWFKRMTTGTTCYMGYNTYKELSELMSGKKELLPGRRSVVFSSREIADNRIEVCNDINSYATHAQEENFFIGGTSIFLFGLDFADWVYLTRIPGDYQCDVIFPKEQLLTNYRLDRTIDLSEELVVEVYEKK